MFVTSHFAKIWQTGATYSPQTFSVTAAVVAPAVAICLNSLVIRRGQWHTSARDGAYGLQNHWDKRNLLT